MESRSYIAAFIVIIIFSALSCKKDSNPVTAGNAQPILFGKVLDTQGNAVEGVGVHYIYSFTSSQLGKIQKPCPATQINFTIPKKCFVTLTILRWFTRDTIETIIHDTVNSGNYNVSVSGNKYTNGLYIYRLTYDATIIEKCMSMLILDIGSLVSANPLCKTNSNGEFNIPYGVFGFNVPLLLTSESSPTVLDTGYISHTIQLVLSKTGYNTIIQTLTIDTTKEMSQTFRFE